MKLAKNALDVGLQIAAADPAAVLAFHRERSGLPFDHTLPLGGGRRQERHGWGETVVKLNHRRGGLAAAAASSTGWGPLTLCGPDHRTRTELRDPEGNRVTLAPAVSADAGRTVEVALRVRDAGPSLAFFAALGLPVAGDRVALGSSVIRVCTDPEATAGDLEGPGFRYVTFQVERADEAHTEALAAGGTEGMAPRTLGEVARISFVVEPGGNWIELSQRASIVGRLDP